jgi:WD40 repeat protein
MKRFVATKSLLLIISFSSLCQAVFSEMGTGSIENGKMDFSENGQFLAQISANKINVFQAETQILSNSFELKSVSDLSEIEFGKGSICYVVGKYQGKPAIIKLNISTGENSTHFMPTDRITGIAYAKDQGIIYTDDKGMVGFILLGEGTEKWKVKAHKGYGLDVTYSREKKLILSGGADGQVVFFDLEGNILISKRLSSQWIREVGISVDGQVAVAGDNSGNLFAVYPQANYAHEQLQGASLKGFISEIDVAPNDEVFSFASDGGEIVIWSNSKKQVLRTIKEGGNKYLKSAVFNPNGRTLFTSWGGSMNMNNYDISLLGIVPKFRFKDETDKTAPLVYISQPANTSEGSITYSQDLLKIVGSAVDDSGIHSLKINGLNTPIKEGGNFVIMLPLQMGENFITIEAQDINQNISVKRFIVNRKDLDGEDYDPAKARNHLFIVGINKYKYWPQLFNAVRDAEAIANTLVGMYNFSFSDVKMLLDEQASLNNIYTELSKYIETVGPDDNLVIYYSGHGFYNDALKEGYWIPYDAKLNAMGEYFSNSNLLKLVNSIQSQHTFLVVDACFSGSLFAPTTRGYVDNVEKYRSRWGLASGRLETVSDGAYGSNSPFATRLLEFLRTNTKDEIPVSEIVQYVKVNVANESNQTPIGNPMRSVGDEGGEFVFRRRK